MAINHTYFHLFLVVFAAFTSHSSHAYQLIVGGKDGWVINPSENYNHWAGRLRFQVNDTLCTWFLKQFILISSIITLLSYGSLTLFSCSIQIQQGIRLCPGGEQSRLRQLQHCKSYTETGRREFSLQVWSLRPFLFHQRQQIQLRQRPKADHRGVSRQEPPLFAKSPVTFAGGNPRYAD